MQGNVERAKETERNCKDKTEGKESYILMSQGRL